MKKKKQINWLAFYAIMGTIDAFQAGIDLIAPPFGEIANEFLDVLIATGICLFCWFKGVLDFMTFLTVLGTFLIEQFTGGGAPFWILDVYAIRKRAESSGYLASEPSGDENAPNAPLNSAGIRRPVKQLPLNSEENIRRPRNNS